MHRINIFYPQPAKTDAVLRQYCNCIKTDPRSGQARRGKHCAPAYFCAFIFAA
nr:MAG TPA: hypothetical protein [Caudoviricetes sp.]